MRKIKAGIILLAAIIFFSLISADFSLPVESALSLARPSAEHLFGCDSLGRDLLKRISSGVLVSLAISSATVVISIFAGLLLSFFMSEKRVSALSFTISDSLKLLPSVPLALFISSVAGPGAGKVVAAMALTMTPVVARSTYSKIAVLKKERFALSSYNMGKTRGYVFFSHILPHLVPYLREQGVSLFLSALLMESSLSFLGAGLSPETPSLGRIVAEARAYMLTDPFFLAIPSIVLFLLGLALVLIVSGLSELDSAS